MTRRRKALARIVARLSRKPRIVARLYLSGPRVIAAILVPGVLGPSFLTAARLPGARIVPLPESWSRRLDEVAREVRELRPDDYVFKAGDHSDPAGMTTEEA